MVYVYRNDAEKEVAAGEVVFDDGKRFRVHSSDQVFDKKEYYYIVRL